MPSLRRRSVRPQPPLAKPRLVEPQPAPVSASATAARPDLTGFVQEVRRQAARHAQGWPGNRRAYISHVWRHVREQRPDWGVSEIEFKCMLAEAHRAGHVALANADLKDSSEHQGRAGFGRGLQERRVPFHPRRRVKPPPSQSSRIRGFMTARAQIVAQHPDRLSAAFDHSITWEDDIWRADPVDVEIVHAQARRKFREPCSKR